MEITNEQADRILNEAREYFKETTNISDVKVLRQLQAGKYIFLEVSCTTYEYDSPEDKMPSVATQIIDSEDLSIIMPMLLEQRVKIDGTRITPQIIKGEAYVKLWALYEEMKKDAENQGIYVEDYIRLYDKESLFNEILSSYSKSQYDFYLKNWKEAYKQATNG